MAEKKIDGFHWEEWRNGVLLKSGWHNGSSPGGEDAAARRIDRHVAVRVRKEKPYG